MGDGPEVAWLVSSPPQPRSTSIIPASFSLATWQKFFLALLRRVVVIATDATEKVGTKGCPVPRGEPGTLKFIKAHRYAHPTPTPKVGDSKLCPKNSASQVACSELGVGRLIGLSFLCEYVSPASLNFYLGVWLPLYHFLQTKTGGLKIAFHLFCLKEDEI